MSYSMDALAEFKRLEEQAKQANYRISDEISFFSLEKGQKILDAGCGAGVLSSYLKSLQLEFDVYAVDQSSIRIGQLREKYPKDFHISQEDICRLSFSDNYFDRIFCRYVLEHLETPELAIKECYRVLRSAGKICLIDLDGVLFNLVTNDPLLTKFLNALKAAFRFDLFIGRRLPLLLKKAGFIDIKWSASTMCFVGEELRLEKENYKVRFDNAKNIFIEALGGKKNYELFLELYLKELENGNVLFYNKFLVEGTKP